MKNFILIALTLACAVAANQAYAKTGVVYEVGSNRKVKLYDYTRKQVPHPGQNTETHMEGLFKDLSGNVVVTEHLVLIGDNIMSMSSELHQNGAKYSVALEAGKLMFSRTENGKTKLSEETFEAPTISGFQIEHFVGQNWAKLAAGEEVRFRYLSLSRGETIPFELLKEDTVAFDGKPSMRVRMQPSNWLFAKFVTPLKFNFEMEAPHRIMAYVGRTSPLRNDGGKWKDLDAEIIYTEL